MKPCTYAPPWLEERAIELTQQGYPVSLDDAEFWVLELGAVVWLEQIHARIDAAERARASDEELARLRRCVTCSGSGWEWDVAMDGDARKESCSDCRGTGRRDVRPMPLPTKSAPRQSEEFLCVMPPRAAND